MLPFLGLESDYFAYALQIKCLLLYRLKTNNSVWVTFILSSAKAFNLDNSKRLTLNVHVKEAFQKHWGKLKKYWKPAFSQIVHYFFYHSPPPPPKKKKKKIDPFPHNDTFWRPWETSLLKTLWEKKKLLILSNFSFSHSVFYLFGLLSSIFVKFEIVVCKLFQVGKV